MKLITKNGYNFATGMFWQIPDLGKKYINLAKLSKDTGHNMYCQIKSIGLTFGFCNKVDLLGEKKVASLGKFIVEASQLSSEYTNSIICYKFKDIGELDDDGKPLNEPLFGYIVLLNGTICPTDGEYVASFELVKNSIIEQSSQHNIETLYLPYDVASKFFNLYERLDNAFYQDEVLTSIMQDANNSQLGNFLDFIGKLNFINETIDSSITSLVGYLEQRLETNNLLPQLELTDNVLNGLKQILLHETLRSKIKENTQLENNIHYLITNIVQIPFCSNDIYWNNPKFKINHTRSLLQSISSKTNQKYKWGLLLILLAIISCLYHNITINTPVSLPTLLPPTVAKPVALNSSQLVHLCFNGSDKLFRDHGQWSLVSMKCNALGIEYMFHSDVETSTVFFEKFINNTYESIALNGNNITNSGLISISGSGKKWIYHKKFNNVRVILNQSVIPQLHNTLPRDSINQIIDNLQQASNKYSFQLNLSTVIESAVTRNKCIITANLSPVFLLKHGVLNEVKLNMISMTFNASNGSYNWIILGEF